MARRSKGGVLLPVIVVVAAAAVFGGNKVVDTVTDFFGGIVGGGTEIIGEGDAAFMVASSAKSKVDQCTAQQVIQDKKCGEIKIIVMDALKMAFITRNMSLAWTEGKEGVLTKNKKKEVRNRRIACPPGKYPKSSPDEGSCEEFPFASTDQGGENARTEQVPLRENRCQGGTLSRAYQNQSINDGDDFLVVIANPNEIADKPFWGVDIAKDRSCTI